MRPDGKSQVTVEYRDGKPVRVDTIVVSTQHSPDVTSKKMNSEIIEKVIKPVMPKGIFDPISVKYYINPTGRFVIGGPMGDTGLTGRKIIVDTYGGVRQSRRRRVLRKRSQQGGSLGLLHGAVHRQEHRGGRTGATSARCSWPMRSAWPSRCRS